MIVDCDTCAVRGDACGGCVITVLLGAPPNGVRLDPVERRAIDALADAGMIPQLRLVHIEFEETSDELAGWGSMSAERSDRRAV